MANVWRRQPGKRLQPSDLVRNRAIDAAQLAAVAFFESVSGGAVTGTGAVAAAKPSLSATGVEIITGTGALSSSAAALSGTAAESISGIGAVATASAGLSGSAQETVVGVGSVAAQPASLSAGALEIVAGAGAVVAAAAVVAGDGVQIEGVAASGGVVAAKSAVDSTGVLAFVANGSIAASTSGVTGEGYSGVDDVPDVVPSYHGGVKPRVVQKPKKRKRRRPIDDPEVQQRLLEILANQPAILRPIPDRYARARAQEDALILELDEWVA